MRAGRRSSTRERAVGEPWRGYADFLDARRGPLGARRLELRGRRHEARASRQALLPAPALPLLGAARRRPGREPERIHVVLGTRAQRAPSASPSSPPTTGACRRASARSSRPASRGTYPDPVDALRALPLVGDRCDARAGRRRPPEPRRRDAPRRRPSGSTRRASRRSPSSAPATAARAPAANRRARPSSRCASRPRCRSHQRDDRRAALRAADARGGRAASRGCPRPSAGDVFFDMEGDPFYEDGARVPVRRRLGRGGASRGSAPSGGATAPRRSARSRSSSTS